MKKSLSYIDFTIDHGYRNGKLLFGVGVGIGVAATLLYFYRKRVANLPPKK